MTLKPADLSAIESAVAEAEARTTGEIYVVVSEESGDYGETPLAWAAGAALLGPALLLLAGLPVRVPHLFGSGWTAAQTATHAARDALLSAILLQAVLFVLVLILTAITPVRRALTPRPFQREKVRRRALEQFAAKNLHATRERTGVLIYVSFAERMAELIADEGIASVVENSVWDQAMAALVEGLKRDQPGAGIAAAVGLCGDVLAERFPCDPSDNPNELPDPVVILPRV